MPARWVAAHADALVGVALILIALVFWREMGEITVYPDDAGLGAKGLPTFLCAFIACMGLLLTVTGLRGSAAAEEGRGAMRAIKRFGLWVLPLAALSFVYVEAVQAMQYLLPTVVATAIAMAMFKNRGVVWLIVAPITAACLFYGIFFIGLGLYEPPGYWLNLF